MRGLLPVVAVLICLVLCDCTRATSAKDSTADQSTDKPILEATLQTPEKPSIDQDGALVLPPETKKVMAIRTVRARKTNFEGMQTITFQIFREADEKTLPGLIYRTGYAYGSVLRDLNQPALSRGESGTVSTPHDPSVAHAARVVEIDNLPAAANQQKEVVLEILDKENRFGLGEFVSVVFFTTPLEAAIVIPRTALLNASDGTFVYLDTGKGFRRTIVKIGAEHGADVQIEDGLKEGDAVVTSPVQSLWLTELQLRGGGGP